MSLGSSFQILSKFFTLDIPTQFLWWSSWLMSECSSNYLIEGSPSGIWYRFVDLAKSIVMKNSMQIWKYRKIMLAKIYQILWSFTNFKLYVVSDWMNEYELKWWMNDVLEWWNISPIFPPNYPPERKRKWAWRKNIEMRENRTPIVEKNNLFWELSGEESG